MSSDDRIMKLSANVDDDPFPNCSSPLEPGVPFDTLIIPPEILLSIFEILFRMEEDEDPWEMDHEDYDAILRMALMPDSVSNVCTYWDFVASLEPKFWQMDLILMDPMQPNPLSRLRKRFERHKGVNRLRIKVWTPQLSRALKWRDASAESVGNKSIALERDRVGRIIPLIQKHAHRACSFAIATVFEESLPALGTVFPTDPKGTHSMQHLYLMSHPSMRKPRLPTGAMSWKDKDKDVDSSTLLVYPDPSFHPALEPSHFSTAEHFTLHGKAFVSFCREYLTLREGKYNAIGRNREDPMEIIIKDVEPFDGGTETPFTLDEFLQVIRLFLGKVGILRMQNVFLPLPVPAGYEEKSNFFENYPWVEWKDQEPPMPPVHCLQKLRVIKANSEVVYGLTMLLYPRLMGNWATVYDDAHTRTSISDLWAEIQRKPGELMSCTFDTSHNRRS